MPELRDRIADAIRAVDMMPSNDADPYLEMADAVLAALGLGLEWGCGTSDSRHGCRCSRRYVTDWQVAND